MDVIAFTKVDLPYGWLGNMSPHTVQYDGMVFKTSEHLFQWKRFEGHPEIQEEIKSQKSPMGVKMKAKKHRRILTERGEWNLDEKEDRDWMRICLLLKLESNPHLINELKATAPKLIIEDVSARPNSKSATYWGAALVDGEWVGQNVLGTIWMKIREDFLSNRLRAFNLD